uniref:Uncharacterized protein n=1 Tax=Onchocerca volvulus TaxID=6282 RepID=A0A8R1Y1U2_ONCVO
MTGYRYCKSIPEEEGPYCSTLNYKKCCTTQPTVSFLLNIPTLSIPPHLAFIYNFVLLQFSANYAVFYGACGEMQSCTSCNRAVQYDDPK